MVGESVWQSVGFMDRVCYGRRMAAATDGFSVSAAHNLSSSVAHKLSGLKITREVIRDETNDSVTGGQEDEI